LSKDDNQRQRRIAGALSSSKGSPQRSASIVLTARRGFDKLSLDERGARRSFDELRMTRQIQDGEVAAASIAGSSFHRLRMTMSSSAVVTLVYPASGRSGKGYKVRNAL
jgi:hypothetical protein